MKKLKVPIILAIMLVLLTGCGKKGLYALKTDINNKEEMNTFMNALNWNEYTYKSEYNKKYTLFVDIDGTKENFKDEDFKTLVTNGIEILTLINGTDEIIFQNGDKIIIEFDRADANRVLKKNFHHDLIYYGENKKNFEQLEKDLASCDINNCIEFSEIED